MGAHSIRVAASLHPDTPRSPYSPGPVRRSADSERAAVEAFVDRHPEYGRLSHLELVTLAATYVGPGRSAERDALDEAGVSLDWHRPFDDEDDRERAE
jgi:hypothetical protein